MVPVVVKYINLFFFFVASYHRPDSAVDSDGRHVDVHQEKYSTHDAKHVMN